MDLLAVVLGVIATGLAVWAWVVTRRLQADEIFEGITPGLTPAAGTVAPRATVFTGEYRGEIAVAFNPPKVRPGLAGAVVHGRPETRDVVASIVDLAARGFLRITIVGENSTNSGRDWELQATEPGPDAPLEPNERQLLDALFENDPVVRLSALPRRGGAVIQRHRLAIAEETVERGWFRTLSGWQPFYWMWVAAGAIVVTGFAIHNTPIIGIGLLTALWPVVQQVFLPKATLRTAEGTALRIQMLGFKTYLARAEKEQFAYEEAAGIFSKYLPYAIVLGVADHWTRVFSDLAASADSPGLELGWLGISGWGIDNPTIDLAMLTSMDGLDDVVGDLSGLFDVEVYDIVNIGAGGDFGGGDFGGGGGGGGD